MKTQIEQLIANGQTEAAIQMLVDANVEDAILLLSRFNSGKKQFNRGMIDYNEWQRIQNQLTATVLDMVPAGDASTVQKPQNNPNGKKVFISYNHGDFAAAQQVQAFLEANGQQVIIDDKDMPAGMEIMTFIEQCIHDCDVVLSIVSGKSLQSGWVGQESMASMYAVWLADKVFIPVRLDNVVFDIDFQIAAQESLLAKLTDLDAKINKLKDLGGDPSAAEDERRRLNQIKNNLGQIIQRFKSVLILDIFGDNFAPSMDRVLARIKA